MKNSPLVSIVINNYNYDRFLGEAMQSALDQSYTATEIVVVDDGSTDHSREVIRRFQREYPGRVSAVLKSNGGQASAFNAGFAATKGEIITFLDSDDYWFRDRVARVVEAHGAAGVVQHTLLCQHRLLRVLRHSGDLGRFLREIGLMRTCVPTSALSFRRSAIAGAFPLPEEPLRLCADAYVRNYAVYHHGIASLPACLGVYRRHGENRWQDQMRFKRPNMAEEIRLLLNQRLEAEGCAPIPANPRATEEAFLQSFVIEAGETYIVYGAGSLGLKVKARIESLGGSVVGFADRDPAKQAAGVAALPVHAPARLVDLRPGVHRIVLGTTFVESALEALTELGLKPDDDFLVPLDIEGRNDPGGPAGRKKVILFGASKLGEQAAAELAGTHEILGFVDNDARKWGGTCAGHPIRSPETLRPAPHGEVMITSSYCAEIQTQLRGFGLAASVYTPSPIGGAMGQRIAGAEARFFCPVCERAVAEWLPFRRRVGEKEWRCEEGGRLCPHCGSFERTRHIVLQWKRTGLLTARPRFLHVAPERGLIQRLRAQLGERYVTADLDMPEVNLRMDLTNTGLADGSFGLIYCSNVLEHIPADRAAMAELFRMLEPGGLAIVQVPTRGEVTVEDPTVTDPARRAELFGQADHVRYYGRDVQRRLEAAGFIVQEVTMPDALELSAEEVARFNCGKRELVHFCRKPQT